MKGQMADETIAPRFRRSVTHEGLHDGVVGGVHVGVQREGALALAVVRRVALRSDDPVLRAEMEGTFQTMSDKTGRRQDALVTRPRRGFRTTASSRPSTF